MNNETDSSKPPMLLDQVRTAIRLRRMSYRTEQAYCDWIKRFILYHNKRHPREEVQAILAQMEGKKWLMASLLYGTGMRLSELLRLRVKAIDLQQTEAAIASPRICWNPVTTFAPCRSYSATKMLVPR